MVAKTSKQNKSVGSAGEGRGEANLEELARTIPTLVFQLVRRRDGRLAFTFVSDGSQLLLGMSSSKLMREHDRLLELVLEEDRTSFEESRDSAAELGAMWNWEGRIRLAEGGDVKWINVRAAPARRKTGEIVWNGFATNVTSSKVASVELNRARKRLQTLALRLEKVREEERAAIARELHDDLGAALTALKINAVWLSRTAPTQPDWQRKVAELDELIDRGADTMRRIASHMRHPMLDYGMRDAFKWQTDDFSKRTGIACSLATNVENDTLRPELATVLFRLLQEALTNVTKHANATDVQVRLWVQDGKVELAVRDNGKGITQGQAAQSTSFGLRNARQYAEIMGADFTIRRVTAGGTLLRMRVRQHETDELNNTGRFQLGMVGAGKRLAVLPLTMTQPMAAAQQRKTSNRSRSSKPN